MNVLKAFYADMVYLCPILTCQNNFNRSQVCETVRRRARRLDRANCEFKMSRHDEEIQRGRQEVEQ